MLSWIDACSSLPQKNAEQKKVKIINSKQNWLQYNMQKWPVTRVTYFQGLHLWNHERRHKNLKGKSGDMGSQSIQPLYIATNYSKSTSGSLKLIVKRLWRIFFHPQSEDLAQPLQLCSVHSGLQAITICLSSFYDIPQAFWYWARFAAAFFLQNFQILMRFTVSLILLFFLSFLPIHFTYMYSVSIFTCIYLYVNIQYLLTFHKLL